MSEDSTQTATAAVVLTPRGEEAERMESSVERSTFAAPLPPSSPSPNYPPVPVAEVTALQTPSADTSAGFGFPARGAVGSRLALDYYPHSIHEALTTAIENLGLPLEQTVRQCLGLYMEQCFPISPIIHLASLEKHVDLLLPASRHLFQPAFSEMLPYDTD